MPCCIELYCGAGCIGKLCSGVGPMVPIQQFTVKFYLHSLISATAASAGLNFLSIFISFSKSVVNII